MKCGPLAKTSAALILAAVLFDASTILFNYSGDLWRKLQLFLTDWDPWPPVQIIQCHNNIILLYIASSLWKPVLTATHTCTLLYLAQYLLFLISQLCTLCTCALIQNVTVTMIMVLLTIVYRTNIIFFAKKLLQYWTSVSSLSLLEEVLSDRGATLLSMSIVLCNEECPDLVALTCTFSDVDDLWLDQLHVWINMVTLTQTHSWTFWLS